MKEEIQYFVTPTRPEPFTIEMCGTSYCDGSYFLHRTHAEIAVIEYVEQGTGTVRIGQNISFSANAGDVYLLPKGANHFYFSDNHTPWIKHFFNIKGRLVDHLLAAYQLDGKYLLHCPKALPFFVKFLQTASLPIPREEAFDRCAVILQQLFAFLYRVCLQQPEAFSDADLIKNYLDQNLSRLVTIRELAALIHRSPDYTIKIFKQKFQQTPYQYFLHQKMEAAKQLLLNTSLQIQEISNQLGYEDAHYFSNLFKQRWGVSPRMYQQKYLLKEKAE